MRYVLGVETDPDGQIAKGLRGAHRPSRGGTSGTESNERNLIKHFHTPFSLLTFSLRLHGSKALVFVLLVVPNPQNN